MLINDAYIKNIYYPKLLSSLNIETFYRLFIVYKNIGTHTKYIIVKFQMILLDIV